MIASVVVRFCCGQVSRPDHLLDRRSPARPTHLNLGDLRSGVWSGRETTPHPGIGSHQVTPVMKCSARERGQRLVNNDSVCCGGCCCDQFLLWSGSVVVPPARPKVSGATNPTLNSRDLRSGAWSGRETTPHPSIGSHQVAPVMKCSARERGQRLVNNDCVCCGRVLLFSISVVVRSPDLTTCSTEGLRRDQSNSQFGRPSVGRVERSGDHSTSRRRFA